MTQILPAILDKTPEDFKKHIKQLKDSVSFKDGWVHIDFADNKFVPNQTIGIDTVIQNPTNLSKEAHLMVIHPLEWLKELKETGFERVIFHYESADDSMECINKIRSFEMEVGIALNKDTEVDQLEPFKDEIDLILIMGVVPGFQGQPFLPEAYDKIKSLKAKNWPVKIAVDGAVRDTNAKQIVEAGADQLCVGSYLLQGDIDENLEILWEALR